MKEITNYTPGPWIITWGDDGLAWYESKNAGGISGSDPANNQTVCEISQVYDYRVTETESIDFETMHANAELIALAPTLYELAKAVFEWEKSEWSDKDRDLRIAIESARKLLTPTPQP